MYTQQSMITLVTFMGGGGGGAIFTPLPPGKQPYATGFLETWEHRDFPKESLGFRLDTLPETHGPNFRHDPWAWVSPR